VGTVYLGMCVVHFGKIWDLLTYATFASLFYILTILGFILRKKPHADRLYKFGYPFLHLYCSLWLFALPY
jgi:hypothetical protein